MRVEMSVLARGDSREADLESLYEWLRGESPKLGRLQVLSHRPPRGELGAGNEILQVTLGAGGTASVLAGSIVAWIRTRRSHVRVRVRRADGEELELDGQVKDA